LALTDELVIENAKLPEAEHLTVTDSRITICPSGRQGGDDYWNMDQMVAQVSSNVSDFGINSVFEYLQQENAMKIAHRLFPNAVIHWIFDNSSCHGSLAKDALTVTKMNINLGRKNVPHMHNTVIPLSNQFGKGGQVQTMQFDDILPDDDPNKRFQGQPKGIGLSSKSEVIHGARNFLGTAKTASSHAHASPT